MDKLGAYKQLTQMLTKPQIQLSPRLILLSDYPSQKLAL